MSAKTGIEWTNATWNPIAGCSVISPGCTNCYAMRMAARLDAMGVELYKGLTQPSKAGPVWNGTMRLAGPKQMKQPERWREPRRVFVNSMSDLFHDGVKQEWIDHIFAVMDICRRHTFQILTKRSARMRSHMVDFTDDILEDSKPLPNVWLGVSVENRAALHRIDDLRATPAAKRFLSVEPLLEDLGAIDLSGIHWVIVGGESGPGARPMHPDWVRDIRDQCADAGVAFFFKQWGEWAPGECANGGPTKTEQTATWWDDEWLFDSVTPRMSREMHCDDEPDLYRIGKKAAGALLDGIEHKEFPLYSPTAIPQTQGGVDG